MTLAHLPSPDKLVLIHEWVTRRMKNTTIVSLKRFCNMKGDKHGMKRPGKEDTSEDLLQEIEVNFQVENALPFFFN